MFCKWPGCCINTTNRYGCFQCGFLPTTDVFTSHFSRYYITWPKFEGMKIASVFVLYECNCLALNSSGYPWEIQRRHTKMSYFTFVTSDVIDVIHCVKPKCKLILPLKFIIQSMIYSQVPMLERNEGRRTILIGFIHLYALPTQVYRVSGLRGSNSANWLTCHANEYRFQYTDHKWGDI